MSLTFRFSSSFPERLSSRTRSGWFSNIHSKRALRSLFSCMGFLRLPCRQSASVRSPCQGNGWASAWRRCRSPRSPGDEGPLDESVPSPFAFNIKDDLAVFRVFLILDGGSRPSWLMMTEPCAVKLDGDKHSLPLSFLISLFHCFAKSYNF